MQTSMAGEHQLETLRIYGALVSERPAWGGRLVLSCGEGCSLSGIPAAASIAGAASLAIDPDSAAAKAAMRDGELDFVVNTLDEALRTLKNEVRQRRPLSVGLITGLDAVLAEMVERGLLPDLLMIGASQVEAVILGNKNLQELVAMGTPVRRVGADDSVPGGKTEWMEAYLPAANAVELRGIDERLLSLLPVDDLLRRRWVQQAPRYLREARSGGRWVWLSEAERVAVGGRGSTG